MVVGPIDFSQSNESHPLLSSMQMAIQNRFLPQSLQAQIQAQLAQAREASQRAAYLGEQTKYYKPTIEAENAYKNAAANFQREDAKFLPLKYAIEGTNSLRTNSRFGNAYEFSKMLNNMSPAQREAWITQHQSEYNDLVNTMGNRTYQQQDSKNSALLDNIMNQMYGNQMTPQGGNAQVPINQAPNDQQGNQLQTTPQAQTSPQSKQAQPFVNTPEQDLQSQLTGQIEVNRKASGSQINNRADAAVALESWLETKRPEYAEKLENALNYSSAKGRGKKFIEGVKGAVGFKQDPRYADFNWATHQFRTELINQIKLMGKMGSTDEQRKELLDILDGVDSMKYNPETSRKMINSSIKTIGDLSDSVFEAGEPTFKGVYRKAHNIPKMEGDYLDYKAPSSVVRFQSPDGKTYSGPADKVEAFLKEHPDHKRLP